MLPANGNLIIFLDMDGVIADLEKHAFDHDKYKEDGKLDHEALDSEWWSTMPAFEGAKEFYYDLKKRAPVKFLSAPMPTAGCVGGKAAWIEKFLSRWQILDLMICRSSDKHLIAGPHRILIDDREENINEWEEAGGIGILHEGDFQATLQKLDQAIAEINRPFSGPGQAPGQANAPGFAP